MPHFRTPVLLTLAFLVFGCFSEPVFAESTPNDEPTHTVTITYDEGEGVLQPEKIEILPVENGVRPPWQGEVDGITVLSSEGQWVYIDELLSSGHQTGVVAESFLPTGETVLFVAVHTRRSGWVGWRLGDMRRVVTEEITFFNQDGTQAETEEGEKCSTAGCSGLVDPWTCECFDDLRDPWEEVRQSPSRVSFMI